MKFETIFQNIYNYAKVNGFRFFIIVALSLIGLAELEQYYLIFSTRSDVQQDLDVKVSELKEYVNTTNAQTSEVNDGKFSTVNSKLQILESAIKPNEKRRMLIKSVRAAIEASNAGRAQLDIHDLNTIAISVIDSSYMYNLSVAQVLAQIRQESDFIISAESKSGAKGLMQIVDSTAEEIARDLGRRSYNIWDIQTNIEFGCYYMSKMLRVNKNNYEDALRSYNIGPQTVKRIKVGEVDFSLTRAIVDGDIEKIYLVNKKGDFILDESGERVEATEEHKYPAETQEYVDVIKKHRAFFSKYGLDRIE